MKIKKPHFRFSKRQRNGVFFLGLLIIGIQLLRVFFVQNPTTQMSGFVVPKSLQLQLDSLHKSAAKNKVITPYPFNPNYISEAKAYRLGLSLDAFSRLQEYRATGKFINSAKEFQQVTLISDSLLQTIAPSFSFPTWIRSPKRQKPQKELYTVSTTDLNKATHNDLVSIRGIGNLLAERILSYKQVLKGFSFNDQLYEVWGLDTVVVQRTLEVFSVQEIPVIKKVNINTASFKEVLALPYIDYPLCKKIFSYRDEVAEIQSLSELKNIEGFPLKKYDRIVLYLLAE